MSINFFTFWCENITLFLLGLGKLIQLVEPIVLQGSIISELLFW